MLCIIDLCGDEDTILVCDEEEVTLLSVAPLCVPTPALQIMPVENDES